MLAVRLRVRPCSERFCRSSSGRWTVTALPPWSRATRMLGWTVSSSLPLGPSTRTVLSATRVLSCPGCRGRPAGGLGRRLHQLGGHGAAGAVRREGLPRGSVALDADGVAGVTAGFQHGGVRGGLHPPLGTRPPPPCLTN